MEQNSTHNHHVKLRKPLHRFLYLLTFLVFGHFMANSQTTEPFNSAPTLIQYPGVPSWKQTAEVTIHGVVYHISNSGNGGWAFSGSGGASNSSSLYYSTAATSNVYIKRKDGQPFQFYGVWLKYTNFTSYPAPYLTVTYNGSSLANETYGANTTVTLSNKNVTVTAVTLTFSGLWNLNFDNVVVGPAIVAAPTVTTGSSSNLGGTYATVAGNASGTGITERGIVWGTTSNPTTANNKVTTGSSSGNFSNQLTGLSLSTTYHARAYAINSGGTSYGSDITFTTTNGTGPATLYPTIDSYNYWGASYPNDTRNYGGGDSDNWLKFDLSLVSGAAIASAKLRIYVSYLGSGNIYLETFGSNDDSWTASTITTPSQNLTIGSQLPVTTNNAWVEIDVTSFVQSQYSGDKVVTLVLTGNDGDPNAYYGYNSDNNNTNKPELVVTPGAATPLGASISAQTNVACNAGATGAATVSATGGTAPYSYSWSPSGGTSATATGLTAGTYVCTITDASSGTTTASATITQPTTPLALTPASQTNIGCNAGSTGAATVNAATGGTAPYTYNWTPGNPTGDGTTSVSGLTAGTWTCTVTDANGCTKSQNFTVTQPTSLSLNPASQTNITCNGGSNGAAAVNVAVGGTAPYTYNWTPGNPTGDGTTSVTGLTSGTWTCTVTDANGCTKSQNFTVTQPTTLNLTAASQTNIACNGGSTGAAAVNVATGGTAPYTYNWTPGNPTGDGTTSITGLSAGTWTCTVTDANGCTTAQSFTVTQPTALSAAVVVDSNVSCGGNADGGLTASAVGGTAPYTYLWSNSATTATIVGVTAGTYNVTITDANGCTANASGTVTQQSTLVATATLQNVSCFGGSDGSIDLTVTGGKTPYTFDWGTSITTEDRTGLAKGVYTVLITDSAGCTLSKTYNIIQPSKLVIAGGSSLIYDEVFTNGTNYCTGSSNYDNWVAFRASIDTTVVYSSITISGSELPGGITATDPVAVNQLAKALRNGTEVSVTINGTIWRVGRSCNTGCSQLNDDVELNANNSGTDCSCSAGPSIRPCIGNSNWGGLGSSTCSAPTQNMRVELVGSSLKVSNVSCQGGADGAINVNPTGGTAPYSYVWSNSSTDTAIQNLTAGSYIVQVTDANGCTAVDTIAVTEPDSLTLNLSTIANVSCNGYSDGALVATVAGGTAPYIYRWSDSTSATTLTGVPAGRYSVFVTDANGCTISDSIVVSEPIILTSSTVVDSNVSCNGLADGGATVTATGGTSPYAFSWSNGDTTAFADSLAPGKHYVTLTDANGCTFQDSVEITEPTVLSASVSLDNNESCTGANDGGLTATAVGGTAPYTYTWNNTATTAGITGITSGNYSVTITDANGCTANANGSVIMVDTISPVIHIGPGLAVTDTVDFALNSNGIAGFASPVSSFVNLGVVTDACGIDTAYFTPDTLNCSNIGYNTITITAKDINGNSSTRNFLMNIQDVTPPQVVTKNVTVYLNANGQGSIVNSDIENGSTDACGIASSALSQYNFDCSHIGANTVMLSVTDIHGNVDSAAATVTVLDTISPKAKTKSVTAYLNANGIATVTPADVDNGSSDICNYTLSLSQTSFDCTETGLNLKTFTITDASGNTASKDVLITIKDTISPTLHLKKALTVSLDQFGNASISAGQLDSASTDNCSNLLFFSLNKTSFNCSNLGDNQVMVTAFDNKNNSTSGIATVNVVDYLAPVVNTRNVTAYLDANGSVTVMASAVNNATTDNCTVDSLWLDKSAFGCANLGQNVVKLFAKDQSGNVAQANAVVTVVDTISPMVITQNATIYLNAAGTASISAASLNNGSADNCAVQSMSLSKTTFGCSDLGINTVLLTVVDAHANSSTASAVVTVMDTISPMVATQNITVALDASGNATITAATVNNGSTDACGIQSMTLDVTSFTCAELGANTVTLTVTDNHSNVSAKTATVTVVDNVKPVVATQNITIYLDANGNANIVPADVNNGSTDNCGITNYSLDISVFDCADLGQNLVILTATDASNNSGSKSAFVTVLDTINPSIDNLPANITVPLPPTSVR